MTMRRNWSVFQTSRGVTLVEMLIGVAVIGVLLAVAAPSFSKLMERRRVVAAAGEIASLFTFARSETNVINEQINLHMEPPDPDKIKDYGSCIRVSTGSSTDSCQCDIALPADRACPLGSGKLLREYLLPRGNNVSFQATKTGLLRPYVVPFMRGALNPNLKTVQVTVTGATTGAQLRIEFNNAGRVRTCSPNGSLSGYPVCE